SMAVLGGPFRSVETRASSLASARPVSGLRDQPVVSVAGADLESTTQLERCFSSGQSQCAAQHRLASDRAFFPGIFCDPKRGVEPDLFCLNALGRDCFLAPATRRRAN